MNEEGSGRYQFLLVSFSLGTPKNYKNHKFICCMSLFSMQKQIHLYFKNLKKFFHLHYRNHKQVDFCTFRVKALMHIHFSQSRNKCRFSFIIRSVYMRLKFDKNFFTFVKKIAESLFFFYLNWKIICLFILKLKVSSVSEI